MTLSEFLLARIAEDEKVARTGFSHPDRWVRSAPTGTPTGLSCTAVLVECEAKRAIVARHDECGTGHGYCDDGGHGWGRCGEDRGESLELGCADLADLALPYAEHPDYVPEWKP